MLACICYVHDYVSILAACFELFICSFPNLLLRFLLTPTLEFFYDLLAYVARSGKKIAAGETVGRSATERLKVQYVPSPVDPETEVWLVELPKARKKKSAAKARR